MSGNKCCDGYICCLCKKEEVIDIGLNFHKEKTLYLRSLSNSEDVSIQVVSSNFYLKGIFQKLERNLGIIGVSDLTFSISSVNELVCTYIIDDGLSSSLSKYFEYDTKSLILPGDSDKGFRILLHELRDRRLVFEAYDFFKRKVGELTLEDIYTREISYIRYDQDKAVSLKMRISSLYQDLNEGKLSLREQTNSCVLFCSISIISGMIGGYVMGNKLVNTGNSNGYANAKRFGFSLLGVVLGCVVNCGSLIAREEHLYSVNRVKGIINSFNATAFKDFICDDFISSDDSSDSDYSFGHDSGF